MPTLIINGRDVEVGDEFLKLSPEQQNATVDEIAHSMGVGKSTQSDVSPSTVDAVGNTLGGAALSATHGVPIVGGLVDKGIAGLSALGTQAWDSVAPASLHSDLNGSLADRYIQSLNHVQGQEQQFQANHPNIDRWAPAVGAIASTAPIAPYGLFGASQGPGLLSALGRAAIIGTEGGIIGGTDAKIRGQDPLAAAILGGIGGAGGSLAGDALGAIYRGARYFTKAGASDRASTSLGELANYAGLTPEDIKLQLEAMGPDAKIADIPAFRAAVRGVASVPSKGQQSLISDLVTRDQGASARVQSGFNRAMGDRQNVLDTADQIFAAGQAKARPIYDSIVDSVIPQTDDLVSLMSRPTMREASGVAMKNLADKGVVFDPHAPTLQYYDEIKRVLDGKIGEAVRSGNRTTPGTLMGIKSDLVDYLDKNVPEYANARATAGDYLSVAQALADGQKALQNQMRPEMVERSLAKMGAPQKEAWDTGLRQAVGYAMDNATKDVSAARNLLTKGGNDKIIGMSFGDDARSEIARTLSSEKTYADTLAAAKEGSRTAENQIASKWISEGAGSIPDASDLKPTMLIARALGGAKSKIFKSSTRDLSDELALSLIGRDVGKIGFNPAPPKGMIAPNIAALLVGSTLPAERQ